MKVLYIFANIYNIYMFVYIWSYKNLVCHNIQYLGSSYYNSNEQSVSASERLWFNYLARAYISAAKSSPPENKLFLVG